METDFNHSKTMNEAASVGDVVLRDPYEVLGVERGASAQEIKSACMPAFFYPMNMSHAFPALSCPMMQPPCYAAGLLQRPVLHSGVWPTTELLHRHLTTLTLTV